ncbi:hypothetical protein MPTK1_1g16780 [Marchantia polymorpha subsp. ruderalis]|uniref:DUF7880 domain-containing protein n=2 Tax=Marchantia polymorpha TaxID=3197 RepID=A0AAF6AQY9_MARPO|nr:hypothetical protein MARPO_0001s0019 [Marchantia polymorpha]BBM98859.1 hypothetical protein Mp_1g16780 [Marchantia polymorpha subsp. ruderalis]|eukprot:PTQ49936.1 hypothetical protein MARPO_0001s0019 [Marchantia polymorpha]
MACLRRNFSCPCEFGFWDSCVGEGRQQKAARFLRMSSGPRIRTQLKVETKPLLVQNCASTTRASNGSELGSGQHGDDCTFERRALLTALIGGSISSFGNDAQASDVPGALSKYIKRKKLDPLETYVPTILLAQSQFQEVDGRLEGEASKFADARSLLRNGPAASLRTDIRAVAQYAAESGNERVASAAVDQCLSALEDLDGLLFQASRSQDAPIEKMRQRLSTAVTAIDRLLATVPAAILEKGKAVAKAYRDSD